MKNIIKITSIGILLITFPIYTYAIDSTKNTNQINEHLGKLLEKEKKGGQLYCDYESGGKREDFKSCESFLLLKKKGCFGYSTYEMSMEAGYSDLCEELQRTRKAQSAKTNNFKLDSDNWWKNLPAEVIPMPGGIYSDSSWEIAKVARDNLVKGKKLGEISFLKISATKNSLDAVISVSKEECGKIEDTFKVSIKQIADFNGDGSADLLLKGYRVESSDSCHLGSGNSLGAGFSVLVQKRGAMDDPEIIKQKNK